VNACSPLDPIEAAVSQDRAVVVRDVRKRFASPLPPRAAHLEYIREIGGESHGERHFDRVQGVVGDPDAFDRGPVSEHTRSEQVHEAALQYHTPLRDHVRVGEVGAERRIVLRDIRAEQERLPVGKQELEARQEPRPLVVDAVRAARARHNVAVIAEHRERIPVFQHAQRRRGALGLAEDGELFLELQNAGHERSSSQGAASPFDVDNSCS
jgi:hypothetical protein